MSDGVVIYRRVNMPKLGVESIVTIKKLDNDNYLYIKKKSYKYINRSPKLYTKKFVAAGSTPTELLTGLDDTYKRSSEHKIDHFKFVD